MQPFQIVFSYYLNIPAKQEHKETWCRTPSDARNKLQKALPANAHVLEAWLVEWRKKDAPMEQLVGHVKQPHMELLRMVTRARDKLKRNTVTTTTIRDSKPPPKKKPETEPYKAITVYYACSARDVYLSQKNKG